MPPIPESNTAILRFFESISINISPSTEAQVYPLYKSPASYRLREQNPMTKMKLRTTPNLKTRFAPSPTGYLHLGHVLSMLYIKTIADSLGAEIILRIEDHDPLRSKQHYIDEIIADLDWMGFSFSNRDAFNDPNTNFIQSNCNPTYLDFLDHLVRNHSDKVFGCTCSRKFISEHKNNLQDKNGEWRYPGTCFNKKPALSPTHNQAIKYQLADKDYEFEDILLGKQVGNPFQTYGAMTLQNRDAEWSYHFSNLVDDIEQGINLVIRGTDILSSTHRQINLAESLCQATKNKPFEHVIFCHHPLSKCSITGKKLSKRSKSESIFKIRIEKIASPEQLLAQCLKSIGIHIPNEKIDLSSACELLKLHHDFGTF